MIWASSERLTGRDRSEGFRHSGAPDFGPSRPEGTAIRRPYLRSPPGPRVSMYAWRHGFVTSTHEVILPPCHTCGAGPVPRRRDQELCIGGLGEGGADEGPQRRGRCAAGSLCKGRLVSEAFGRLEHCTPRSLRHRSGRRQFGRRRLGRLESGCGGGELPSSPEQDKSCIAMSLDAIQRYEMLCCAALR